MLPEILKKVEDEVMIIGFTTIEVYSDESLLKITHTGNMGNGIDSVRKNVDRALKKGAFDELRKTGKTVKEVGSPDYMYILELKF